VPHTTPDEARSQILDVVGESVAQAHVLKKLLEDEHTALETQDIDALDAIVGQKSACSNDLQALDQKRDRLCQQWGFAAGANQMQQLIDWCDKGQIVSDYWDELVDIAAAGRTLNLTNGAIIRVRQQHFESSLSVLRGAAPGSDTYGRNGEESGDFSRRSLAEA